MLRFLGQNAAADRNRMLEYLIEMAYLEVSEQIRKDYLEESTDERAA